MAQHRPELNSRANPVPCAMGRSIWTFHEDSGDRGRVATEPIASRLRPQLGTAHGKPDIAMDGNTPVERCRATGDTGSQVCELGCTGHCRLLWYLIVQLHLQLDMRETGLNGVEARSGWLLLCCSCIMGSGGREGSGELWPRLCHPNLSSRWRDRRPPLSSQCIRASEGAEYHRTGRANRLITPQLRRTETRPMLSPGQCWCTM